MIAARDSQVLLAIPFLFAMFLSGSRAHAQYGGGTGELNDPFLIYTAEQLNAVGLHEEDWNRHFKLMVDIDLSGFSYDRAVIAPDMDSATTSFDGTLFAGVFDGNGCTISNLTVTRGAYLGLFGSVGPEGEIRDLAVVDVNITNSRSNYVGGLLGYNSGGHVLDCYSTGTVRGKSCVGGLVGRNHGAVTRCYSISTASGDYHVGGLIGSNGNQWFGNGGIITYCSSTGSVSGGVNVGGLVGYNGGDVIHCYSTGIVRGETNVGGLAGCSDSAIIRCYSKGTAAGGNNVGGLMGYNRWGDVTHCFSMGPASGEMNVGGLVGHNRGMMAYCYSTSAAAGNDNVGGLVGYNRCEVARCFWDTNTSGLSNMCGGQAADATGYDDSLGKITSEMQTDRTYLDAGWDFVGETENGTDDIWWIHEGHDYPKLAHELSAFHPHPHDGAIDVMQPLLLSWVLGGSAVNHDVYFDEEEDTVTNATPESSGIYLGQQPTNLTTHDPGTLEYGKTYYWRIDEVNEENPQSPWKGRTWSFTTADFILVLVVDGFENYSDDDYLAVWQAWIDGFGDPNNASQVGYLLPPYAERAIVHGGALSMPVFYDNTVDATISEALRTLDRDSDWTINDADTLTLHFRGRANNDPDTLYVAIEDRAGRIAVVKHPDAEALLVTEWQRWHVSLPDMQAANVDLTEVLKIRVGVGDRDNPQPGGAGKIYVDDIWITNRMP